MPELGPGSVLGHGPEVPDRRVGVEASAAAALQVEVVGPAFQDGAHVEKRPENNIIEVNLNRLKMNENCKTANLPINQPK